MPGREEVCESFFFCRIFFCYLFVESACAVLFVTKCRTIVVSSFKWGGGGLLFFRLLIDLLESVDDVLDVAISCGSVALVQSGIGFVCPRLLCRIRFSAAPRFLLFFLREIVCFVVPICNERQKYFLLIMTKKEDGILNCDRQDLYRGHVSLFIFSF